MKQAPLQELLEKDFKISMMEGEIVDHKMNRHLKGFLSFITAVFCIVSTGNSISQYGNVDDYFVGFVCAIIFSVLWYHSILKPIIKKKQALFIVGSCHTQGMHKPCYTIRYVSVEEFEAIIKLSQVCAEIVSTEDVDHI